MIFAIERPIVPPILKERPVKKALKQVDAFIKRLDLVHTLGLSRDHQHLLRLFLAYDAMRKTEKEVDQDTLRWFLILIKSYHEHDPLYTDFRNFSNLLMSEIALNRENTAQSPLPNIIDCFKKAYTAKKIAQVKAMLAGRAGSDHVE